MSNDRADGDVDVIGIVKEVHELGSVTSKATNKPVRWVLVSHGV